MKNLASLADFQYSLMIIRKWFTFWATLYNITVDSTTQAIITLSWNRRVKKLIMSDKAYHTPPQRISIAAEISSTIICHCVFLGQIDEIRRKYETKEPDIERCYEFLQHMQ